MTLTLSRVRRRRGRKLARFAVAAAPFVLFSPAVFILSLLPALVDRGALNAMIERTLSVRLGAPVTIQGAHLVDNRMLVLEGVRIRSLHPLAESIHIDAVRARFGFPFPLGRLENIRVEGPLVRIDADDAKLTQLMAAGSGATARPSVQVPREFPGLEIVGGVVEGTLGEQTFRVHRLHGFLDNSGGGTIPFQLIGRVERRPDPEVIIRGRIELTGEPRLIFERLKVADFDSDLTYAGGPDTTLLFRLRAFSISRGFARTLQNLAGGPQVMGLVSFESSLTLGRDGRLVRFVSEGTLQRIRIAESDLAGPRFRLALTPIEQGVLAEGTVEQFEFKLKDGPEVRVAKLAFEASQEEAARRFRGRMTYEGARVLSSGTKIEELKAGTVEFDVIKDGKTFEGFVLATLQGAFVEEGDAYQDLTGHVIRARLQGRFDLDRGVYEFRETSLAINDLGSVFLSGRMARAKEGFEYDLAVRTDLLNAAQVTRLGANTLSAIAGFDPEQMRASGRVEARARFHGDGQRSETDLTVRFSDYQGGYKGLEVTRFNGEVRLSRRCDPAVTRVQVVATFTADEIQTGPFRLAGARGTVPLVLARGTADAATVLHGELAVDELFCKQESLGPQRLPLEARAGVLRTLQPISGEILGGRVTVGPVTLESLAHESFAARTSLTIRGAQLAEVIRAFGGDMRPEGTFDADFEMVEYKDDNLRFVGSARLSAFQGQATFYQVRLNKLTSDASCTFAVDLERISLQALSRALCGQGIAHGVISGTGRFDVFEDGQLQEFELQVWNVPGAESQILSLKAAAALVAATEGPQAARSLEQLPVRRLYYSDLGLYARLNPGGRLLLRGKHYRTVSEAGLVTFRQYTWDELRANRVDPHHAGEYIMVGTSLHRINIILTHPGRTTNWDTFIHRWKDVTIEPPK